MSLRGQVLEEAKACIYLGALFVTSALAVIIKATTDIAIQPEVEESSNVSSRHQRFSAFTLFPYKIIASNICECKQADFLVEFSSLKRCRKVQFMDRSFIGGKISRLPKRPITSSHEAISYATEGIFFLAFIPNFTDRWIDIPCSGLRSCFRITSRSQVLVVQKTSGRLPYSGW